MRFFRGLGRYQHSGAGGYPEDSLAALYGWEDLVADHDAIRDLLEAIGFGIDDLN